MKQRFLPLLPLLFIASAVHAQSLCGHIFDEVQRFEGLSGDEIAPLRSGCEADVQAALLGYWQCMDEHMQNSGYHLDNMLTLGAVCKDATAKPLADLTTD